MSVLIMFTFEIFVAVSVMLAPLVILYSSNLFGCCDLFLVGSGIMIKTKHSSI